MAQIKRTKLFGKLNTLCYKTVEGAAVFCKMRGNPYIELVHWIHQIIQKEQSDLTLAVRAFDLDSGKLSSDIVSALDRLPRGATSISDFSPHLEQAIERGWIFASFLYNASAIRSGHLLIGILRTDSLKPILHAISQEFTKIDVERLENEFDKVCADSEEVSHGAAEGTTEAEPGAASDAISPAAMGKGEALKKFTENLTETAASGKMDPITGRDDEIRQVIDILMRRRQNNPILVGEAGVGKTAVVEGFAQRIVAGDVPPAFKDVQLHALDVGLLSAGASMKGEFESRLKQLIEEVQGSEKPIILFIDEAHTLVGAGGQAGQGDAANLLKPALARGTLRTIGATTFKEYKKYIEKDPALTRRFQTVQVGEPDDLKCTRMLRGIATKLAEHHGIEIFDEAISSAVSLSRRYLPDRQLPDKAVSLLDTACARVAVSQHAKAATLEDAERNLELLQIEKNLLEREQTVGHDDPDRRAEVDEKIAAAEKLTAELQAHYDKEKVLVDQILAERERLLEAQGISTDQPGEGAEAALKETPTDGAPAKGSAEDDPTANPDTEPAAQPEGDAPSPQVDEAAAADALAKLKELDEQLTELQGEHPMIFPALDASGVAAVISDWTGIPAGRMVHDEISAILHLVDRLKERVIGQDHALQAIAERIQTSKASMEDPRKPIGVFMLVGPSGTGKTETALTIAEALYGGEQNLITINMSEYQEAHTVSTLKGSPPGYVGYGEGGVLTEAVRRRPYSVVLLDEVEKAHPDVHEIFFQVFDKGQLQDSEGRMIDFKNTIILLTSNCGSDLIMKLCEDPEMAPDVEGLNKALREPLLKTFPAALLGRLNVVPYFPLSDEVLELIIKLSLRRVEKRLRENHGAAFTYSEEVVAQIKSRCTEVESGGRMIESIITLKLLPGISQEILRRMLDEAETNKVEVDVKDGDFVFQFS